jgi:hypothetical protein
MRYAPAAPGGFRPGDMILVRNPAVGHDVLAGEREEDAGVCLEIPRQPTSSAATMSSTEPACSTRTLSASECCPCGHFGPLFLGIVGIVVLFFLFIREIAWFVRFIKLAVSGGPPNGAKFGLAYQALPHAPHQALSLCFSGNPSVLSTGAG